MVVRSLLFILQSAEAAKLQPVNKDKERMQEASHKAQELSEAFSKETEKKLSEKMEVSQENKNAQMLAKQERLKEHVCFTDVVCNCGDSSNSSVVAGLSWTACTKSASCDSTQFANKPEVKCLVQMQLYCCKISVCSLQTKMLARIVC